MSEKKSPKLGCRCSVVSKSDNVFVFLTQKQSNARDDDCLKRCPRLDDGPVNNGEINFMYSKGTLRKDCVSDDQFGGMGNDDPYTHYIIFWHTHTKN